MDFTSISSLTSLMLLKKEKKEKRKEQYQTHEGDIIFPFLTVDAIIAEGG